MGDRCQVERKMDVLDKLQTLMSRPILAFIIGAATSDPPATPTWFGPLFRASHVGGGVKSRLGRGVCVRLTRPR